MDHGTMIYTILYTMVMDSVKAQLRPNAGHGLWLAALVPLCYCINSFRYAISLELQYQVTTIVACGLFGQSLLMFHDVGQIFTNTGDRWCVLQWLCTRSFLGGITALVIWSCLAQSLPFSLLTGFAWPLIYELLYWRTLRALPGSFTLGEASIVTQGFVLFLLNAFLRLIDYARHLPTTSQQEMTVIVQVTLLGTAVIVAALYAIRPLRGLLFYPLCLAVGGTVMAFPVGAGGGESALSTLVWFVIGDLERLFAVILAAGLLGATGSAVAWFVQGGGHSSTRTRKYFHVLIVLVFVPGLLYQCTLLFVASGMLLAVFVLLEAARIVRLWPVHAVLQTAVATFLDAQDASGLVAFTPIYLLVGCAMPMWLHPCGCDLTDWAGAGAVMALSAGVLSVGIGDAAASVFGSLYGRHKWTAGGIKSFEGTICSVLAQALVVPLFMYLGVFRPTPLKMFTFIVAIVTNSVVEAKTDQIDNLVLPLVTYAILSGI